MSRISLVLLLALLAAPAWAQSPQRVHWSLRTDGQASVSAGATVPVTLVATIDEGWHVYSLTQPEGGPIALTVSVPAGGPFRLAGDARGPDPEVRNDTALGIPIELYSGVAEITVPLELVTVPARGGVEGSLVARFQVCSDTICLPPRSVTLPLRIDPSGAERTR